MSDPREIFIRQVAPGMTFAEVGGLFGTIHEKISVAALAGATELTQIDLYDRSHSAWDDFLTRNKTMGNNRPIECLSCDFQNYEGKSFDVIHSGGVFYHLPNPFLYLTKLREKAKNHVILSSLVLPTRFENEHGSYVMPASGVVFVPALTRQERLVLNGIWNLPGLDGIGSETQYKMNNFAPVWWLATEGVLKKMCEVAGFEILDSGYFWPDRGLTLLLR